MTTDAEEARLWNRAGAHRTAEDIAASRAKAQQIFVSNPAKLNPRCWNCDKPMSHTLREITVFCSSQCEREYHSTEPKQ